MGWLAERVAEWNFRRTPLAQALREHVQEFFYRGRLLSWFSEDNRQRLINEFLQKASAIYRAADPIAAGRETLVEYVLFFSPLMAVALTEAEKADHPMFSGQPAISGELHHHIRQAAEHIDELGKMLFDQPDATDDELVSYMNTRSAVGLFFANGMNMIRIELGDRGEWYRPLLEATMVADEDRLRDALGLPRLLEGSFDALAYGNFFEYVLGQADPFYAWKKDWPRLLLYGRGDS